MKQHEITKIGSANTTRNKEMVCVVDAAVSKNTLWKRTIPLTIQKNNTNSHKIGFLFVR